MGKSNTRGHRKCSAVCMLHIAGLLAIADHIELFGKSGEFHRVVRVGLYTAGEHDIIALDGVSSAILVGIGHKAVSDFCGFCFADTGKILTGVHAIIEHGDIMDLLGVISQPLLPAEYRDLFSGQSKM